MHIRKPGRRGTVALLLALCLTSLLTLAGLSWADGEDDPSFNGSGTVYVPAHEGTTMAGPPVVDQAADGTVVAAMPLNAIENFRGFPAESQMNVPRFSAAGAIQRNDVIPTLSFGSYYEDARVFDVEALPDGEVVVAHAAIPVKARAKDDPPLLVIMTVTALGAGDFEALSAPDDCESDDTRSLGDGEPMDADIADDGTVYVVWDCDSGVPQLAKYVDGALVDNESIGVRGRPEEVVLGPNGSVFVSLYGEYAEESGSRANFPFGTTLVTKHDGATLARDESYGNDGAGGGILPGFPLDLTVDPSGRAVVWVRDFFVERRGSNEEVVLLRLDAAGDLDTTWGTNGVSVLEHPLFGDPDFCPCEDPAHLIAQADGKVVVIGPSAFHPDRSAPQAQPFWFIARTTATGQLDPAWDEDGVRGFDIDGEPFESGIYWVGEPGLQRDGKLLVPSGAYTNEEQEVPGRRIPVPPAGDGGNLGVSRIGLTPAQPPPQQQQPPPQGTPAGPPVATPVVAASQSRTCKSRRSFTIRLRTGRKKSEQSPIVSAVVRVNGKKVKVNRGARRTSRVVLTQLPKGRFTVDIRLRLKDGGRVHDVRRYRTCTKKIERELAPLRTRPPRR